MNILECFFVNNIQKKFLSIISICRTNFLNSSKTGTLTRKFHSICSSEPQKNDAFCFQDCVLLLQHLRDHEDVNYGRSLHSFFIKSGLDRDVFVQNNMIRFYGDICGDLKNAHLLFDEIPEPSLISWTSLVSSYIHDGQHVMGLYLFSLLCQSGLRPNEFGFSVALKACRVMQDPIMGRLIHSLIIKSGFESHSFCSASVVHLYAECGDMENSRKLFDGISLGERSEALWNTLLNAYVQMSDAEGALHLFHEMGLSAISPNCLTYTILVKLCANVLDFELARCIHCQTVKLGIENDVMVGGSLVDTYSRLRLLDDACEMFQVLKDKDNVALCSLLAGFNQIGKAEEGLTFFINFLYEGNKPDPFTCASIVSLCSNLKTELAGTQVHCSFIKLGLMMDSYLGSAFINMYGTFGMISDAYKCFLEVCYKNEICISAMINALVLNSNDEKALDLFCWMKEVGIVPSKSTINFVLRVCGNLFMLKEGRSFHSYIIKIPCGNDKLGLENALLEMYSRCGVIDDAKSVFHEMQQQNEFSWTTVISGCGESGQSAEAFRLFRDMLVYSTSSKPSQFTLVSVIQACAIAEALDLGKQVHSYIIKSGFEYYPFIGSALVNMYAAFKHEIFNAYLVFLTMRVQDLISWSTMLTSWVQNGYHEEALELFAKFQTSPIFRVDESILSSCLSAAAGLAASEIGKCFHSWVIRLGFENDLRVASSIIDMYSKCGNIKDARRFFNSISDHNLVSWTVMIYGYAYHGLGKEAIDLFNEAKEAGIEPDGVTFSGVLTACSHAGLVQEGWELFEYMRSEHNCEVTINHYACMADLLGRVAKLEEAEALIKKSPFHSKSLLWKTLLGACYKHENAEVGIRISKMLVDIELNDPSTYVLLSNIYASASMWQNSTEFRNKMIEWNVNKKPGSSWIQVAG